MRPQPLRCRTLLHFLLDGLGQLGNRRSQSIRATPADRVVAGSPIGLTETPPVVSVRLPEITSSCSVSLRSMPRLATDSSSACAPVPSGVGATAVAADHDSPSSAPRSAESDLPAAIAESAAHPGDPSSACVLASYESRRHPQSTTRSSVPLAVVQTSAHAHWLPSPRAPSFPGPRAHGRTSPLPHGVAVGALVTPRCPYLQTQFAERPGGNHIL